MKFQIKNIGLSRKRKKEVGKIYLTKKQSKRTLHLPIENVVYVPSTYGVKNQKIVSDDEMASRVNEVRAYLSKKFGGYTSVSATGGYVMKNGKLVKERIVQVHSFSEEDKYKQNETELINQVGKWGNKWKQESISYENEGDLYVISPPKIKKK